MTEDEDSASDIADEEELFARAETDLDAQRFRWSEAYQKWRNSAGDHVAGRELTVVTARYLSQLGAQPGMRPVDHRMLRFVAGKIVAASARYPDLWHSDYPGGDHPKGGRIQSNSVRQSMLEAVRYVLRFKDDDKQKQKAKIMVADIYGTTIRSVNNWISKFSDAKPNELVFLGLDEISLWYHAQEYRLWKSSENDRRSRKKEN